MEVEIDKNREQYTDFYWIVRRNMKIYEGDISCIGSGPRRKQNCYDASRRKRLGKRKASNNGIIKYELSLMIDRLEREDLEDRIFLVRDFREVRTFHFLCGH